MTGGQNDVRLDQEAGESRVIVLFAVFRARASGARVLRARIGQAAVFAPGVAHLPFEQEKGHAAPRRIGDLPCVRERSLDPERPPRTG